MAQSGAFDHIAMDDRGDEATWQREERLIARGIKAINLHLSEGGTWYITISWKIIF